MNIFELHERVLEDYDDFVGSFVTIYDERVRDFVGKMLEEERRLWPEPLVQLSPAYKRDKTVQELAEEGVLHPETARIFRSSSGQTYRLFRHQVEAIRRAREGKSFVVTSGTGSGKSFCYFIPIVDAVVRCPEVACPVAIIVYPMNALVNSQEQALRQLAKRYRERTGRELPVRFARYTGETEEEEREKIRRDPPHILLTNYVMAELLLVRPEDRQLIQPREPTDSPFFLVFDELHTYRGRQGADVAMLVRRLRARLARPRVVHIGTSATLVAHPEATPEERRQVVAEFASRFFGAAITPNEVIEETLETATVGGPPGAEELRQSLSETLPDDPDGLRRHPLVRWVEYTLGVQEEADGRLRRRPPRPLSEVAKELARQTGEGDQRCQEILKAVFLQAARLNENLSEPFFAFKLHQFISQGRAVYATLEPPNARSFSSDGEMVGNRPTYPLRFCRICGQEYYHVIRRGNSLLPHPMTGELFEEDSEVGYLAFVDDWDESRIPEDWRNERGGITHTWRDRVPQLVWVHPDGTLSSQPALGAAKAWWQSRKLWLCLRCDEYYNDRQQDFSKLSYLSGEGRSSATTVLAMSILRHAARIGPQRDKMLTFTDSRQDASLQAGHFNDFVRMAVLRSGLYRALEQTGQLRFDTVARETMQQMGLQLGDIARTPTLDPDSAAARQVWEAFERLTEYRLYMDLRRGWRVLQPNLEDVGLLRIEYDGLREACEKDHLWSAVAGLKECDPQKRFRIVHTVLDHFRKRLAIDVRVLEKRVQNQLGHQVQQQLNEFWGLDPDVDYLESATWFALPTNRPRRRSEATCYWLSVRAPIGRYLQSELGPDSVAEPTFFPALLEVLVNQGFLRRSEPLNGYERYQLNAACLIWNLGDGTPPPRDPIYARGSREQQPVNRFFQRFYREAAQGLASLEAREHTAQVVAPGERHRRERRFRWLPEDRQDPTLGRRLPYLICSPTMELGVDIADLDVVHMRNVPPTPANYAQRSGRAGRQGQPGLIFTYCSAGSSHDQYFFHNQAEMVAGAVRAPRLELANEALIRAHIQAEWLAEVGLPLRQSIEEVVDIEHSPELPLRDNASVQIHLGLEKLGKLRERLERIFAADQDLLARSDWFSEKWLDRVLEEAPTQFDHAFDRWRELYRIATHQLEEAHRKLQQARSTEEQQKARREQEEALRQRNLLLQVEVAREESDFYPYRYLATEGFLPGYNFPALPVRAWVPRGEGEFITRPRALAIREFAPHNVVYHEGAKWQVNSFFPPPGGLRQRCWRLRLCRECGSFSEQHMDRCPGCNVLFDGANSEIIPVLDLPNVRVIRRERITCNEEERIRLGYDVQVAYQFSIGEAGFRTIEADVQIGEDMQKDRKKLARLRFGPAATLLYINRGWKGRVPGFTIDLASGALYRDAQQDTDRNRSPERDRAARTLELERLSLSVWETQNILLIRFADSLLRDDAIAETSLLYALKRGIEQAFQLEESELDVMMVGREQHRAMLLFEATEGGLGVLRRLVEEPDALAEVAVQALAICHFTREGADLKRECVRACYECLLSYSNQPEGYLLDRHRVRGILQELTRARVHTRTQNRSREEHLAELFSRVQSTFEREFLQFLSEGDYRLPDDAQKSLADPRCIADFFYSPNILVFCDGPVHDEPNQSRVDANIRRELQARGYRILVIRWDKPLEEQIREYPEVFQISAGSRTTF